MKLNGTMNKKQMETIFRAFEPQLRGKHYSFSTAEDPKQSFGPFRTIEECDEYAKRKGFSTDLLISVIKETSPGRWVCQGEPFRRKA